MSSASDVTALLRFLSQEAKVPLAQAMSKIPTLQAAQLNTALDLSKADFETLKGIFDDEKAARQCLNAAKRVSKKRSADQGDAATSAPPAKRTKPTYGQPLTGAALEASLALPDPEMNEDVLKATVLYTNRAPLVLAFATTLIKYTMPEQPISSRLSLAQAVTSMNSKTKAAYIGLAKGQSAEDEGWGEGQPLVRVMTREIRVMKRWGYEWEDESDATQSTIKSSPDTAVDEKRKEPALWGVDLEALKKANQPGALRPPKSGQDNLPIYNAQSARAYLMRAFEKPPADNIKKEDDTPTKPKVRRSAASIAAEKERNLGLLLGALELLYQSWAKILSKEDLDKRAWSWYVHVRPKVAPGAAGWGGKGNVPLSDILDLRRSSGD
ncbi:putative impact protein [Curvularia clavata]|uniref:Impact protein n=1 Tax=Curvularia clavata TaxID=95742 RepID=A0A9Q8Z4B9_CURCL|nr:putative impact protein [Curvularia clavata]